MQATAPWFEPMSHSERRYCGLSVVGSPLALSSPDAYAKKDGQPRGQPLAAASPVGCVFVCSTVTYAFVAVAPVKAENIAPMPGCTWPRGPSVCWNVEPICVLVLPSNSFTTSVVVENCEALTSPMFVRYWPLLRSPVMKTLSRPTPAASE